MVCIEVNYSLLTHQVASTADDCKPGTHPPRTRQGDVAQTHTYRRIGAPASALGRQVAPLEMRVRMHAGIRGDAAAGLGLGGLSLPL